MREIFVFESDMEGEHARGSAFEAFKNHGAVMGHGSGVQGNSYAIPTLDENLKPLRLDQIARYIDIFISFAWRHYPTITFNVCALGCGIAGYRVEEIAPLFRGLPENCLLPPEFLKVLEAVYPVNQD